MVKVVVNGEVFELDSIFEAEYHRRMANAHTMEDYIALSEWVEFMGQLVEAPST